MHLIGYIITQNFHPQLDLGRRHGTERDRHNLTEACKKLGFEVEAFDDLTYHEILEKVEKCRGLIYHSIFNTV